MPQTSKAIESHTPWVTTRISDVGTRFRLQKNYRSLPLNSLNPPTLPKRGRAKSIVRGGEDVLYLEYLPWLVPTKQHHVVRPDLPEMIYMSAGHTCILLLCRGTLYLKHLGVLFQLIYCSTLDAARNDNSHQIELTPSRVDGDENDLLREVVDAIHVRTCFTHENKERHAP